MIENKIPWTKDTMKRAGPLFFGAHFYGIQYTEQDFEYIEKNVKTDKLYRLISQQNFTMVPETPEEKYQKFYNNRVRLFYLTKLLDDPDITPNVSKFIYCFVGERKYWAEENAKYYAKKAKKTEKKKTLRDYDLTMHNFFIERWLEICR